MLPAVLAVRESAHRCPREFYDRILHPQSGDDEVRDSRYIAVEEAADTAARGRLNARRVFVAQVVCFDKVPEKAYRVPRAGVEIEPSSKAVGGCLDTRYVVEELQGDHGSILRRRGAFGAELQLRALVVDGDDVLAEERRADEPVACQRLGHRDHDRRLLLRVRGANIQRGNVDEIGGSGAAGARRVEFAAHWLDVKARRGFGRQEVRSRPRIDHKNHGLPVDTGVRRRYARRAW